MSDVYIMIGIPGSGKSTYIKKHFNIDDEHVAIVSPDEIRKEFYGDISIQGNGDEVFSEAYKRMYKAMVADKTVIFDATNAASLSRKKLIKTLKTYGYNKIYGIYMNTPFEVCQERNKNRTDRSTPVPDDVMIRMYTNMLYSERDLFSDGFDELLVINLSKED